MTSRSQLESYLDSVRHRLQWVLSAQGAALLVVALFAVTLVAAALLPQFGFGDSAAMTARALLVLAAATVAVWFVWRRRVLRRDEGAAALERALPSQAGRVATYLQERQKPEGASPLLGLLAADALSRTESEPLESAVPKWRVLLPTAVAAVAACLFAGLFVLRGPWSEGAKQLWLGRLPAATSIAAAAGGIAVKPGDAIVRRNQDLPLEALVAGPGDDVQVHVRFGQGDWEIAPMQRSATGAWNFTLFAVRDAGEYYVTAGRLKSREHSIKVVDLPNIEKLRLTYNYPEWTGLAQRTEDGGGDIHAVAGTAVGIQVVTSAPLEGPLLVIDGSNQTLSQSGTTSSGQLAVKKSGHYRIATRFLGEVVPLTPDYLIEVAIDEKPDVRVMRPGKDYRATNIEEVPVRVQAKDDYRLEALELHYSVNGRDFRVEKLPAGSADIQAAAMLRLEEMQQAGPSGVPPLLEPGDLVSYYALARDHSHTVQTDLFLIQVQPFEQRFTQSQAGGGGGGGGGGGEDEGNISRRQKEVLLATWNLQRNQESAADRDAERNADNARMLSEVQTTLRQQATTLVDRAKARALTGQDQSVAQFVKNMEEAAKAMDPAAKNLGNMKLADAVKYEQQALQLLLRAESVFRDIQVAMRQQGGGGGGGGGSQASRDVSEMTELEMDLAKNQYETEQSPGEQGGGAANEAEDEIMRKLRELAKRQEQMAREAQRQNQQQTEAQKWQQEQLRRELEQMRQQLQQLAQQQSQQSGSQSQQGQQGQQQGQQSGQQSRQQGQQGQQSGSQSQQSGSQSSAQRAEQQVAQAIQQMQQGGAQNQQRASEQLNRASEQLERSRAQADSQRIERLADEARDLANRQRASERELRAAIGQNRQQQNQQTQRDGLTYEQMQRMAATRREMQEDLRSLQQQIEATRRQNAQAAPRASNQLAEARKELQEMNTEIALARSASDIERGRGVQAASNDPLISDTLQRLQQNLATAADIAANESGARQQGRRADAGDLASEIGELRRAMERAREQQLAQSQRGGGQQPGAEQSQNAREGQAGQQGGQQGQQGQGQQQQAGNQQGGQSGQNGAAGGRGNERIAGLGNNQGGGGGFREQRVGSVGLVPLTGAQRDALRSQTQLSAERLAQLRAQMPAGEINAPDMQALMELERRLARGAPDPMTAEYQRVTELLSQVELGALKAQQAKDTKKSTRTDDTVDDSRRYRDNVAEYYRKLGEGND